MVQIISMTFQSWGRCSFSSSPGSREKSHRSVDVAVDDAVAAGRCGSHRQMLTALACAGGLAAIFTSMLSLGERDHVAQALETHMEPGMDQMAWIRLEDDVPNTDRAWKTQVPCWSSGGHVGPCWT